MLRLMPTRTPGTTPPIRSLAIETPPAETPKTIRGMLGGMMGPMVEEAAVTAAENSRSKPSFSMARISIVPRPAASATAEPLIPAKTMLARTFACPRPPGIQPISVLQKRKILVVMDPVFMSLPASRKKGIARSVKLLAEKASLVATMSSGIFPMPRVMIRTTRDTRPMAYGAPKPSRNSSTRPPRNTAMIMLPPPLRVCRTASGYARSCDRSDRSPSAGD